MFIEIRKQGKKNKYYLIHSYRVGDKVKRISRYLGSDLNKKELNKLKKRAEEIILEKIKEKHPFELSEEEIQAYKKYEEKIEIRHLRNKLDWRQFTQDFTYNTNAIEGSTVEYKEVKNLLEKKELPKNFDEIETLNVAKAVGFIKNTKEKLSTNLINKLHLLCFDKTKSYAGKLRKVEVVIRNRLGKILHRGAPYKDVERVCKRFVSELCLKFFSISINTF